MTADTRISKAPRKSIDPQKLLSDVRKIVKLGDEAAKDNQQASRSLRRDTTGH